MAIEHTSTGYDQRWLKSGKDKQQRTMGEGLTEMREGINKGLGILADKVVVDQAVKNYPGNQKTGILGERIEGGDSKAAPTGQLPAAMGGPGQTVNAVAEGVPAPQPQNGSFK